MKKACRIFCWTKRFFYPQGGGQPCDHGAIVGENFEYTICNVRQIGDEIRHYITDDKNANLQQNRAVKCIIDKARRLLNARYHTAGHLLGNIVEELHRNLKAQKCHAFPGEAYIEFCGDEVPDDELLLESLRNAITQNLATKIFEIDRDAFESTYYKLPYEIPGNSLMEYFPNRENESIEIAANVIQKLHSTNIIPESFTPIEEVLNDLYKKWNIPNRFIFKAQRIADHLLKTTTKKVAMHGDLHHDNILRDDDEWKIIDPAGVIGGLVYEIASFMINPIDKIWKCENAVEIIQNRIGKFSSLLNINPKRIAQWTFLKSMLCWIWTLETPHLNRAELVILFDKIVGE